MPHLHVQGPLKWNSGRPVFICAICRKIVWWAEWDPATNWWKKGDPYRD